MQERTKLMNRGYSVVLLLSIGLTFFTGQPPIVMASVSVTPSTPVPTTQACRVRTPHYNPAPRVYSPDSAHTGDIPYNGGHVIDGIANVYLIYWLERPISPKYISLSERFVKDFGRSPLYMDLSQYHDSLGRCPTGARLAGTFVDTRSLPSELNDPNMTPDQANTLVNAAMEKEVADVAAKKGWNTQDYHNLYGIFYNAMAGGQCAAAYHSVLQSGSPLMFLHSCQYTPSTPPDKATPTNPSPNHDKDADDLVGSFSHEFSEAVTDPLINGWTGSAGEIADVCQIPQPDGIIDPRTHGDVTWYGHTYLIALEYSNKRHGCVLEGP